MAEDRYIIHGGIRLEGQVAVSGGKNAAVAIIPAALLGSSASVIENLPDIEDVATVLEILRALGAEVRRVSPSTVEINPCTIDTETKTIKFNVER